MMMKKAICVAAVLSLCGAVWAQGYSAEANRRTAMRCLSLAKEYAASGAWSAVQSQAALGISYDSTISDLYYMLAAAKSALGDPKAEVIPLVQTALTSGDWVDYNRDSARVLYADLLCDTGKSAAVPAILDAAPLIYSADAEYIRAKAYYRMGTADSTLRARAKVESARKIYPSDTRFPLLFYTYESPQSRNADVMRMADFFFGKIAQYAAAAPDKDAELEVRAALFARGEAQVRMLQSFSARGLRHPLYASAALRNGLLTEREALDYIRSFADVEIEWDILRDFIPQLKDEQVLQDALTYLNSFEGVLLVDTDGDKLTNMYVKYYRGRPDNIIYDADQDGVTDWQIICDYGVPLHASIPPGGLELDWDDFPFLSRAEYRGQDRSALLLFNLVRGEVAWSPVDIRVEQSLADCCGAEFFFPELSPGAGEVTDDLLMTACYEYTMPSSERDGAYVTFTMLDGKIQTAHYYAGGQLYAYMQYEDGSPYIRHVDANGDGTFETTEVYGFDPDGTLLVHDGEDERSVMTNLFGTPQSGSGFFLSSIQIDSDGDTIANFTEQYYANGGKVSSWDIDADGLWDIRYRRYPRVRNEFGELDPLVEESLFYEATSQDLITVTSVDGVPVSVSGVNGSDAVTRDARSRIYWIGVPGSVTTAAQAVRALDAAGAQGFSLIVHSGDETALAVRVGSNSFVKLVPRYDFGGADDE